MQTPTTFDPSPAELFNILVSRKNRAHKRKSRGYKHSPSDEAENLLMILAWQAGEITEDALAQVLYEGDKTKLHEHKMKAISLGRALTKALHSFGTADD